MVKRFAASAIVFVLMSPGNVFAQATAQISGAVRDSSGAVLPGADVTATQIDTNIKRSTVTDSSGDYTLQNLPVGPYRLEVMLQGFRTFAQTGIVLQVNASPVINVVLSLGALAETVSVEAAAPLVETRTTGVGQVVENERILALPLNGRNPTDLIVLAGGAVASTPTNTGTFVGSSGSQAITVAGSQTFGVGYFLDGATHNNPYDNLNLPLPFPDALQEFRVETSALSASQGIHSGAAVNALTKSGTNQFHGDVFEFLRDRRFNATNTFAARDAQGRRRDDGLNRNQFGGVVGGPILRDRMFFFAGYEGTRTRQVPANNVAFVPTADMLRGDFTTAASPACNNGRQVALRGNFVGNRIDPAQLDRAAVAVAGMLPTATDPCGRVVYGLPASVDEWQTVGKLDIQLSANHSIFGRYLGTHYFNPPAYGLTSDNILTSPQTSQDNFGQSLTMGETRILSSTTVNAVRFAFNRTSIFRTQAETFDAPSIGVRTYSYLPKQTQMIITNAFTIGGGQADAIFDTNTYALSDDFTTIRGNHQWGIGATLARWSSYSSANIRSAGVFTFDGQVTGSPLADFLTGNLSEFRQTAPNILDQYQWYGGVYGQDSWRLSPRVTLNYGVRWEPFLPQSLTQIFTFEPEKFLAGVKSTAFKNAPAGFRYPGDDGFVGHAAMPKQWWKFSPRVGAAWDPAGDGKMSIRSSYGLANDFVPGRYLIVTSLAAPWSSEVLFPVPVGGFQDPFRGIPGGNPFPIPTPLTADAPFPTGAQFLAPRDDLKTTTVQSWNVSVQRQFGANTAVSATYLGNVTDHLWNQRALNYAVYIPGGPCTLPDGRTYNPCSTTTNTNSRRVLSMQNWAEGRLIGALDVHDDGGTQTYHGLMLSAQRRAGAGFTVNGNYTLGRCIGTPAAGAGLPNPGQGYVNPLDIDYDRGHCDMSRTHITNVTAAYEVPDFGGRAVRAALGGWRVSGLFQASSGTWLNIISGLDIARNGMANQRPNQVLDDPYGNGTPLNFLNPRAFAQPDLGTFGDLPRNAVEGPGLWNLDASLVRGFALRGMHRLELRVEAFNVLNHVRLGNPVTNLNSPTFGQIQTALDPRVLQLAVKYVF